MIHTIIIIINNLPQAMHSVVKLPEYELLNSASNWGGGGVICGILK
jgi:hypothetical protein